MGTSGMRFRRRVVFSRRSHTARIQHCTQHLTIAPAIACLLRCNDACLHLAKELRDRAGKRQAYVNLRNAYDSPVRVDFCKAIKYHMHDESTARARREVESNE